MLPPELWALISDHMPARQAGNVWLTSRSVHGAVAGVRLTLRELLRGCQRVEQGAVRLLAQGREDLYEHLLRELDQREVYTALILSSHLGTPDVYPLRSLVSLLYHLPPVVESYQDSGDRYLGASRCSALFVRMHGLLPFIVSLPKGDWFLPGLTFYGRLVQQLISRIERGETASLPEEEQLRAWHAAAHHNTGNFWWFDTQPPEFAKRVLVANRYVRFTMTRELALYALACGCQRSEVSEWLQPEDPSPPRKNYQYRCFVCRP